MARLHTQPGFILTAPVVRDTVSGKEDCTMGKCETALILGASKGLGEKIATACNARGWYTIEVSRSLPDRTRNIRRTIQCDIADVRQALELLRQFDPASVAHFFWVAGVWWKGPFAEHHANELVHLVDVNLRNPLLVCQGVWAAFTHTNAPRTFTVVSSTSGLRAHAHEAAYVTTKWGQLGFTKSIAEEAAQLRAEGSADIRVRLFCPGGMRTELFGAAPPPNYAQFMDPAKVAAHLLDLVVRDDPYIEEVIERTSELGESLR